MQVTVFGASGKVGRLVVAELLRRDFTVIAFVHKHDPFGPNDKLSVVKGDIYDAAAVGHAVEGSEAVISCLGSWGTKQRNVLTTAMQAVIPAMHEHRIKRIVTLTGSGAKAPREAESFIHKVVMTLARPFPAYKVFRDGEKHMELLADSGLDWTTLRSPVMTNGGRQGYHLDLPTSIPALTISRQAVANAMVDELEDRTFIGKAPILYRTRHSSRGQLPKV